MVNNSNFKSGNHICCYVLRRLVSPKDILLQFASLIDGLMVIVLTLRASVWELIILGVYIAIGVIFFATLGTQLELLSPPGEGIPEFPTGK